MIWVSMREKPTARNGRQVCLYKEVLIYKRNDYVIKLNEWKDLY